MNASAGFNKPGACIKRPTSQQVFEGLARDLRLGDLLLAGGVGTQRDPRVTHFLGDRLDFALDACNFLADLRIAHLVASRHVHLPEDDHVIIAFHYVLRLIHPRLENDVAGFDLCGEMHFTLFAIADDHIPAGGLMLMILMILSESRQAQDCGGQDEKTDCGYYAFHFFSSVQVVCLSFQYLVDDLPRALLMSRSRP